MPNLGDIAYQTVAGATSTSTHGTGEELTGLAGQIIGLRLVTADGSVVSCSADEAPEIFHCARVGLGALGIVSTVTLQVVPAFNLHVRRAAAARRRRAARPRRPRRGQRPLRVLLGAAHRLGADEGQQPHRPSRSRPASRFDAVARRLPRGELRVRRRLPARAAAAVVDAEARQGAAVVRQGHLHRPELQGVRQPTARAVLRDGVRHPSRGVRRGAQPHPAVRGGRAAGAQLPGRGALHRPRRHPAVDGERAARSCYLAVHVFEGMDVPSPTSTAWSAS